MTVAHIEPAGAEPRPIRLTSPPVSQVASKPWLSLPVFGYCGCRAAAGRLPEAQAWAPGSRGLRALVEEVRRDRGLAGRGRMRQAVQPRRDREAARNVQELVAELLRHLEVLVFW